MENDRINIAELAWRAGIDRRRAKSSAWQRGDTFRDNGARVLTDQASSKIVARARFEQRQAKRDDKHRGQFADSLRPRVTVDMGGAK
jgi:hypothetical protein